MENLWILGIIGVTLLIFAVYWVRSDPRIIEQRDPIVINLFVALILHVVISLLIPFTSSGLDTLFVIFGIITFLLGAIFALWAKYIMGQFWGSPGQHDIEKQRVLITWGPYLVSRNPIYVGIILMFLGISLALRSYSVILVPGIAYFLYTLIKKEEVLLEEYFGEEYLNYKLEVPRFLII